METKTITVMGMVCDACAGHVTKALKELPGVADASVSLTEKKATVKFDPSKATFDDLRRVIETEGYEVAA